MVPRRVISVKKSEAIGLISKSGARCGKATNAELLQTQKEIRNAHHIGSILIPGFGNRVANHKDVFRFSAHKIKRPEFFLQYVRIGDALTNLNIKSFVPFPRHEIDFVILAHAFPIFILPKYQDRGIGYAAIMKSFDLYPEVETWKLDTILQEERNCHLYEKCGFKRVGEEHPVNDVMTLVDYEFKRY